MAQLEFKIASILGDLASVAVRRRHPDGRGWADSRAVSIDRNQEPRVLFSAARYAFFCWVAVAGCAVLLWAAVLIAVRLALGLDAMHSVVVIGFAKTFIGIVIGAMAIASVVRLKSPSRYVSRGRPIYAHRKIGPQAFDFWHGLAIGVVAAVMFH